MKRILLATVIMLSLVFSFVGTAQAVTDGTWMATGHPYVGLLVAQAVDGTPLWRCSGTLLAPKLCSLLPVTVPKHWLRIWRSGSTLI